jgi:hypothetical protein
MIESLVINRLKREEKKIQSLESFSLSEIKKSSLLPYVKNFIFAEVQEIKDKEFLLYLIDKSVKLNLNYTLRPKWTLLNYLFGEDESKRVEEVTKKLKVFQFYRFYTDLISDFIKESSISVITKGKTKELLEEANSVLYEKLTTKTTSIKIRNFLLQIFKQKYLRNNDIKLSSKIPFQYVRIFLEDKSFYDLLEKFKVIENLSDTTELDLKNIVKVFTDKYIIDTSGQEPPKEKKKKEVIEKIVEEVKEKKEEVIDTIVKKKSLKKEKETIDIKIEEKPIPKKEDVIDAKIKEKPQKKEKDIIDINVKETETEAESFYSEELIEVEKLETKKDKPGKDLTKKSEKPFYLKEEVKIKRLFKKDELFSISKRVFRSSKYSMYRNFDKLERFDSWQDAIDFLKKIFTKNKVNYYHKDVVLFVDMLNDYFTEKEKRKTK